MTAARNASGRFTAPRAEAPKPRSFGERLQSLPLDIKRCERRIDDAVEHKREMLRQYGAASLLAGRVRRQLRDLKDLHLDLIEEAKLLEPIAGREQQQQQQARKTMPTSREQALAMLAALEPWLVANESIPFNDRHAGHDRDRDEMRQRKYYLTGLLRTLPEEAALSKESA